MKIQIALAGSGVSLKGSEGMAYAEWENKMRATQGFNRIANVDSNNVAAYDDKDNIIDTFTLDVNVNRDRPMIPAKMPTDTLDSQQQHAPIDKTAKNIDVDPMVEKGA